MGMRERCEKKRERIRGKIDAKRWLEVQGTTNRLMESDKEAWGQWMRWSPWALLQGGILVMHREIRGDRERLRETQRDVERHGEVQVCIDGQGERD